MTPRGSSGRGAPPRPPPLALVLSVTVTGIFGNVLITPVIPDILADFGVPDAGAGLLLAAATAPGIVLAPVIGLLADRYGRRQVLVPCLVLFALGGGMAAFAPTFATLVALRVVQGAGSAGLINLAMVLIGDFWVGEERTRMIGRNSATLTAAIVVLPPLGGLLGALGGWRLTFAPYWLALGTALLIGLRLPPSKPAAASLRSQLRAVGPVLRTRAVLGPIVLAGAVFALIFGLFLVVVPVLLADAFALGPAARGAVMALPAVTSTATSLLLGRLRARLELATVLALGLIWFAAGFGVIAVAPTLAVLCAGALLYGAGDGVVIAALQDAVTGAAAPAVRGSVTAVLVASSRVGQTVGPALAAAGLDSVGARATCGAGAALAATLIAVQRILVPGPAAPTDRSARKGAAEVVAETRPNR